MQNPLTEHRSPRWRCELLDETDAPIGRLDGIEGGNIELAALGRLGASGSLTLLDRGQRIDWMSHRVRFSYDPGVRGVAPWNVAVMLLTSPTARHKAGHRIWEVELLSKLGVLDEDTVDTTYSLAEGAEIIPAVLALIESSGETRYTVTPSTSKLKSQQVWEAGTPKLTIINNLLEAAGYWSLWCDGSGQLRVEPYVPPAERSPAWEFRQGAASIHLPEWGREQDLAAVPNKFIVAAAGDEDDPGIIGIAKNEKPDSPFSYQARGRWITETEQGVEVEDQAAADQLAARRLADRMAPVAKITATHLPVPLNPNDVIVFEDSGYEARATVLTMRMDLTADTLCSAEWREAV